jgi:hypothetical protein
MAMKTYRVESGDALDATATFWTLIDGKRETLKPLCPKKPSVRADVPYNMYKPSIDVWFTRVSPDAESIGGDTNAAFVAGRFEGRKDVVAVSGLQTCKGFIVATGDKSKLTRYVACHLGGQNTTTEKNIPVISAPQLGTVEAMREVIKGWGSEAPLYIVAAGGPKCCSGTAKVLEAEFKLAINRFFRVSPPVASLVLFWCNETGWSHCSLGLGASGQMLIKRKPDLPDYRKKPDDPI